MWVVARFSHAPEHAPSTSSQSVPARGEVAGVVGALSAIPVGGTIQILLDNWRESRLPPGEPAPEPQPAGQLRGDSGRPSVPARS